MAAINKTFAKSLAKEAWRKHASGIALIDLKGKTDLCRYFLLMNGRNAFHLESLKEEAVDFAKKKGAKVFGAEGDHGSGWILVDFGDIILHIFQPETRRYYDIERLWGDAVIEKWDEAVLFPGGVPSPKTTQKQAAETEKKPAAKVAKKPAVKAAEKPAAKVVKKPVAKAAVKTVKKPAAKKATKSK